MKATTFVHAMCKSQNENTDNNIMMLHDRSDLVKIYGESGTIYTVTEIPEGLYYYLFPDVPEQADFLKQLKCSSDYWEGTENIVNAVGKDASGQTVLVINIFE